MPGSKRAYILIILTVCSILLGVVVWSMATTASAPSTVEPVSLVNFEVVWPHEASTLTALQTFSVTVPTEQYTPDMRVTWAVDGGIEVGELLNDNGTFSATVDVTEWDWNSNGQYDLTFYLESETATTPVARKVLVYTNELPAQLLASAATAPVPTVPRLDVADLAATDGVPQVLGATTFRVQWIEGPTTQNQRFVYQLTGYDTTTIQAFWRSVGGSRHQIYPTSNGTLEAVVNVNGWRWKGEGPYELAFTITDRTTLATLAEEVLQMRWLGTPGESALSFTSNGVTLVSTTPAVTPVVAAPTTPTTPSAPNAPTAPRPATSNPTTPAVPVPAPVRPLLTSTAPSTIVVPNKPLFVTAKPAVERALAAATDTKTKEALTYVKNQPGLVWLNGDGHDSDTFITNILADSKKTDTIPGFVLYNIPHRDCGSHSSGGATNGIAYRAWIDRLAERLKGETGVIVVEPDAIAQLNCAPSHARSERLNLISYAVKTLTTASPNLLVYIDAGHPYWVSGDAMAKRLVTAGVAEARGFSLNVSNYVSNADNEQYGTHLSSLLGNKQFVIDTSRNGNGPSPAREWCNPAGRALGESPRLTPNNGLIDGYLWIKYPGESDGQCNGGPGAGQWWTEYAVALYTNKQQ